MSLVKTIRDRLSDIVDDNYKLTDEEIQRTYANVSSLLADTNIVNQNVENAFNTEMSKESFSGQIVFDSSLANQMDPNLIEDFVIKNDIIEDKRHEATLAIANVIDQYSNEEIRKTQFTFSEDAKDAFSKPESMNGFSSAVLSNGMADMSQESFGPGHERTELDAKIAMTITVLQFKKGIAQRAFKNKSTSIDIVVYRSERFEIFDIQASKSEHLSGPDSKVVPLINLYQYPEISDIQSKRINLTKANDGDGSSPDKPELLLRDNLLFTHKQASLFTLGIDPSNIGTQDANFTDYINEGARIVNLVVEVEDTANNTTTNTMIPVNNLSGALFVNGGSQNDSFNKIVSTTVLGIINKDTPDIDGTNALATPLANFDPALGHNLYLSLNVSGTLNVQEGVININASAVPTFPTEPDGTPTAGFDTEKANLKFNVIAYEVEAYYSETNIRKSTTAVKAATRDFKYPVPASKSIIVEHDIVSTAPDKIYKTVDEIVRIGTDARALETLAETIRTVESAVVNEKMYPRSIAMQGTVMDQYPAGYISRPFCMSTTYDVKNGTMTHESTKIMADRKTQFIMELMKNLGTLKTESFFHKQLASNEAVTWTMITSNRVKELLLSLPQFSQAMANRDDTSLDANSGYDLTLTLPSGDRVNVITTTFESYRDKFTIFPNRPNTSDDDVISLGTLVNQGTFTGTVPFSSQGGASKRFIVNTRQHLIVTNPVAWYCELANLDVLS